MFHEDGKSKKSLPLHKNWNVDPKCHQLKIWKAQPLHGNWNLKPNS